MAGTVLNPLLALFGLTETILQAILGSIREGFTSVAPSSFFQHKLSWNTERKDERMKEKKEKKEKNEGMKEKKERMKE